MIPVACVAACVGAFKSEAARKPSTDQTNPPVQANTFQVAFQAKMRRDQEEQRRKQEATTAEINPVVQEESSRERKKDADEPSQIVEI